MGRLRWHHTLGRHGIEVDALLCVCMRSYMLLTRSPGQAGSERSVSATHMLSLLRDLHGAWYSSHECMRISVWLAHVYVVGIPADCCCCWQAASGEPGVSDR